MAAEWSLYGIITLGVAIFAVIATFVAPYFLLGARVSVDVTGVTEFKANVPANSLTVSILHDGKPVDRQLLVLFATVKNTGRSDLVQTHFIHPVQITLPEGLKVLSTEAIAQEGVGPEIPRNDDRIELKWKILKPRETIRLQAILASDSAVSADNVWRESRPIVRLIDVKTGQGFFATYPNARAWLAALAFGLLAFYFFGRDGTIEPSKGLLITNTQAGPRSVKLHEDELQLCRISDKAMLLESCEKTKIKVGDALPRIDTIGSGMSGLSWSSWFAVAFWAAINANSGWVLFRPRTVVPRPPKRKSRER